MVVGSTPVGSTSSHYLRVFLCHSINNIIFTWNNYHQNAHVVKENQKNLKVNRYQSQPLNLHPFFSLLNVIISAGAHCAEKVLECGCARSCYRMSFHQLYKTTIYDGDAGLNKTLEVVNIWHLSGLIGSFSLVECMCLSYNVKAITGSTPLPLPSPLPPLPPPIQKRVN